MLAERLIGHGRSVLGIALFCLELAACSGNPARSPDAAADGPAVDAAIDADTSDCGAIGQRCCDPRGAPFCTAPGSGCGWVNTPNLGVCSHCGNLNETCCSGRICNSPDLSCRQDGLEVSSGICYACGQNLDPCCNGTCATGLTCERCIPMVDCPQPLYNPNDECRAPDGGTSDAN
jgi:hypothetical protein